MSQYLPKAVPLTLPAMTWTVSAPPKAAKNVLPKSRLSVAGWAVDDLKPKSLYTRKVPLHLQLAPQSHQQGQWALRKPQGWPCGQRCSPGAPAFPNLQECSVFQMEKDETVSDCSPHIANIGRLVEVSGPRAPGLWLTRSGLVPPSGENPALPPTPPLPAARPGVF